MQHWKFAAFGFAVGAMMIFFPMSGKLREIKDLETRQSILMDITCVVPREELEAKLATVIAPPDINQYEKGQSKALWDKAKEILLAECYEDKDIEK